MGPGLHQALLVNVPFLMTRFDLFGNILHFDWTCGPSIMVRYYDVCVQMMRPGLEAHHVRILNTSFTLRFMMKKYKLK